MDDHVYCAYPNSNQDSTENPPIASIFSVSEVTVESFSCKDCGKYYATSDSYKDHLKRVHKRVVEEDNWTARCLEEGCSRRFGQGFRLRNHLENVHNMKMNMVKLFFPTYEEFDHWFKIVQNGFKFRSNGSKLKTAKKTQYYTCNRSGARKYVKNQDRQRAIWKKGPVQSGNTCTVVLKAEQDMMGSFKVEGCLTHYGHRLDDYPRGTRGKKPVPIYNPGLDASILSGLNNRTGLNVAVNSISDNNGDICTSEHVTEEPLEVSPNSISSPLKDKTDRVINTPSSAKDRVTVIPRLKTSIQSGLLNNQTELNIAVNSISDNNGDICTSEHVTEKPLHSSSLFSLLSSPLKDKAGRVTSTPSSAENRVIVIRGPWRSKKKTKGNASDPKATSSNQNDVSAEAELATDEPIRVTTQIGSAFPSIIQKPTLVNKTDDIFVTHSNQSSHANAPGVTIFQSPQNTTHFKNPFPSGGTKQTFEYKKEKAVELCEQLLAICRKTDCEESLEAVRPQITAAISVMKIFDKKKKVVEGETTKKKRRRPKTSGLESKKTDDDVDDDEAWMEVVKGSNFFDNLRDETPKKNKHPKNVYNGSDVEEPRARSGGKMVVNVSNSNDDYKEDEFRRKGRGKTGPKPVVAGQKRPVGSKPKKGLAPPIWLE